MQAVTVETAYFQFIERTDCRVSYSGRQITAIEPLVEGRLYRVFYSETESSVVERATPVIVSLISQRGKRHA